MYFMLAIFKNRLNNEQKVIDIETETASDFSIMATYLPRNADEEDIKSFFEKEYRGTEVSEISMGYDIEELLKLEKMKLDLHDRMVNMVASIY